MVTICSLISRFLIQLLLSLYRTIPARYQSETIYNCFVCSQRFCTEKELRNHLNWSKSNHELLLNCEHCNNYFDSINSLKNHQKIRHSKATDNFHCNSCENATFTSKDLLDVHIMKHSEPLIDCQICEQKFHTDLEKYCHILRSNLCQFTEDMVCQLCDINFIFRSSFRMHINFDHKANGRFVCVCEKTFKSVELLEAHKRSLMCLKCGACFCEKLWKQHCIEDCDTVLVEKNENENQTSEDSDNEPLAKKVKTYLKKPSRSSPKKTDSPKLTKTSDKKIKDYSVMVVFSCTLCHKIFKAKEFLQKHIANKHPEHKAGDKKE